MQETSGPLNLFTLLPILWPWRKHIIVVTFIATLLGILISSPLVIRPKYRSELILYPPNTNSARQIIEKDVEFGSETDADEYIQLLQSVALRDSLAKRFNLLQHYDIDTTEEYFREDFIYEYNQNISFEVTRYNSVKISVLDTDPFLAAQIANAIPQIADNMKSAILWRNYHFAYESIAAEYRAKLQKVEALFDSLNQKRALNFSKEVEIKRTKYYEKKNKVDSLTREINKIRAELNVHDLSEQINILNVQLVKAQSEMIQDSGKLEILKTKYSVEDTIVKNAEAKFFGSKLNYLAIKQRLLKNNQINTLYAQLIEKLKIEKKLLEELELDYLKVLNSYEVTIPTLSFESLKLTYEAQLEELNKLRSRYEMAYNNLYQMRPKSFIISPAEVSKKKVYPIRWLITLLSGFGGFSLAILWIIAYHQIKRIPIN
ncbi:MAG: Wzz/FepE/Etk N-terminal domain-containing protein [Bacteroidia bacterium]|nr:Wzz/FepE/Etk N-terminal domain-containing protein [Bacteroidia bacterium]MDW8159275.1 Wzz/FepE/Etk N-terminal domain-containing protein [Bacteroidia bacterium]